MKLLKQQIFMHRKSKAHFAMDVRDPYINLRMGNKTVYDECNPRSSGVRFSVRRGGVGV